MSRYQEILEILGDQKPFNVDRKHGYANCTYRMSYKKTERSNELTARDGALLADGGNLCFGGRDFSMNTNGDSITFSGVVYTD